MILDSLKFVQGAVAKKDFLPAMTHFVIENKQVRSFNGTIALCCDIPIDFNFKPKAETFVKAIENCKESTELSLTSAGRLKVVSGKFKAFIDCIDENTMHAKPEGERFELNGETFLKAMKTLEPIVSNDATRPWSNGILLKDCSAFATNNIVLAELWTGTVFPITINIPGLAIRELIRINRPPVYGQFTETSATFHFDNTSWLRTQLLESTWPDLSRILDRTPDSKPVMLNSKFFEALEYLKPFSDKLGRVYFKDGIVRTNECENEGALYEIPEFSHEGIFQIEMLNLLEPIAKTIHFESSLLPSIFYGDNIRGAIAGMRM